MSLKLIRLNLARDKEFPQGSSRHGYEIVAPLMRDGHIDAGAWRTHRDQCRVHRFWDGEEDEYGHLVHTRGGNWAFHYDLTDDLPDDEVGYRFAAHPFVPGEYVSVHEHDDVMRTFRVVTVQDVV
ncbi:MAG: hypothetical protein VX871_00255 [Pseudomonadota bacterium]|nr:hypothetical protein [Pseudomonadota bacterium]